MKITEKEVAEKIEVMKADGYGKEANLERILADDNYVAEQKFDGCRYLLIVDEDGTVSLKCGGIRNASANTPHISNLPILQSYKGSIFDGEICSKNLTCAEVAGIMNSYPETAIASQKTKGEVEYHIFDCLQYKGKDIKNLPMCERRKYIDAMFIDGEWGKINLVEVVLKNKREYYDKIVKAGYEGIVLKNIWKPYLPGQRPKDTWIKMKRCETFTAIATGAVEGAGKYTGTLGALKISQYINGELKEVGQMSGMTDAKRHEFWDRIQKGEQWVVEFSAMEKTVYNHYRMPQYKFDRPDYPFTECKWGKTREGV